MTIAIKISIKMLLNKDRMITMSFSSIKVTHQSNPINKYLTYLKIMISSNWLNSAIVIVSKWLNSKIMIVSKWLKESIKTKYLT